MEDSEGDVDILLTCEWPAGVTQGVTPGSLPEGLDASGSNVAAELAVAIRPR